ncbi:MAG: alpha/beta hydrolase [Chloroflexota bacterium]
METKYAQNGSTKIAYQTLGDPKNETIILISGLGSQLVYWTDELCQKFIDRGFHIIRFDNRDVGMTSKTSGEPPTVETVLSDPNFKAPYTALDMAADTVAVLDAVGVEQAHIVGTSMGGMIAQTVAIEHPQRVKTLTSIMSASSRADSLSNDDDAVSASISVDVSNPDTYVDLQVEGYRVTSGPHFDPVYQRQIIQESFDRCYHPQGWAFQMMAVLASGDRVEKLKQVDIPTLVIHGALDPLITPDRGKETADSIPGARWLLIEDMGHNLPRPRWDEIADAITELANKH